METVEYKRIMGDNKEIICKNSGITLLALVVTIIVLLILAGISIAMLTGQNGIITKTRDAKSATEKASVKEWLDLAVSNATIENKNRNDENIVKSAYDYVEENQKELKQWGSNIKIEDVVEDGENSYFYVTVDENSYLVERQGVIEPVLWYTDKNGDKAPYPVGFTVSTKEGENEIKKGLVIEDENKNQYVWIPVDGTKLKYERTDNHDESNKTTNGNVEYDNGDFASRDELTLVNATFSENDLSNGINENITKEIVKQVNLEKASVARYGGFYIGRYETGIESAANTTPQIKAGLEPYTGETYGQTVRWIDAYNKANSINSSRGARTYLCSSYAWDTTINCIMQNTAYKDYATSRENMNENWYDKEVKDSSGNVIKATNTDTRLQTGKTTPKFNIYDMGGNIAEYTTEINPGTSESSVLRSGHYYFNICPAGVRWDDRPGVSIKPYGFRATLILK